MASSRGAVLLADHWWRVMCALAGMVLGTFPWDEPSAGLFGVIPILVWCAGLGRSRRTGVVVGLALLVLLAWFVVPRELGWSGRWVPSDLEVYWLHTVLAAVVCGIGARVDRRGLRGVATLAPMVVVGFFVTGFVLLFRSEGAFDDDGVLPGPAGLHLAEGDGVCGSGGCDRDLYATGDHAREAMRAHLASRGFTPRSPSYSGDERMCRGTGLLVPHETCATLRDLTADEACAELTGHYTRKAPCAGLPDPRANAVQVIAYAN